MDFLARAILYKYDGRAMRPLSLFLVVLRGKLWWLPSFHWNIAKSRYFAYFASA